MLSKTAKYGLKAIMFLTFNHVSNKKFTVKEMAKELDVPQYFLSKILHDLSKANLVSSQKGPGGGFFLSKEQLEHNPYVYLKALEGDNMWNYCLFESKPCEPKKQCVFHHIFTRYKENFVRDLSSKTLKEYIEEE